MSEQPPGPLFENLVKLKDMMPKLAKGIASRKLTGRAQKLLPTKACKMCDDVYDRRMTDPTKHLEHGICPRCQEQLDKGYTAVRNGKDRRWITLPAASGMVGKFLPVIRAEMDALIKLEELIQTKANAKKPTEPAAEVAPVCRSCARPEPTAGSGPEADPLPNPG